jgi:hypothetical protein
MPALLTTMSTRPKARVAASTRLRNSLSSPRSAVPMAALARATVAPRFLERLDVRRGQEHAMTGAKEREGHHASETAPSAGDECYALTHARCPVSPLENA